MKKILFLGYTVSPDEITNYSGASVAGNKMQWNVIRHLAEKEDVDIECITITPHASFPREKNLFQRCQKQQLVPGVFFHKIPYCNLPVIKQMWQIISVYSAGVKVLRRHPDATLLCFNLFPQVGIPMRWLQRKFPQLKTVCLLADLPIDDQPDRKGLWAWLRKKFDISTLKSMQCCQRYIVLNGHVAETYFPQTPYIVVDGGVDEEDVQRVDNLVVSKNQERNILFCGALTEYNGIRALLDAMHLICDDRIRLDIYGGGPFEPLVRDAAKQDFRIRFHGRVENATVLAEQKKAWLLINPRVVDDPISKVTFPSKTFEYMLSGTPTLTTRLNGYSKEYDDKLLFSEGDAAEQLAFAVNNVLEMSQEALETIAQKAKVFVLEERTWKKQTEKIYRFCIHNA